MKTLIIKIKGIILVLMVVSFYGCTTLLFENPIPDKGETIQTLPKFLNGEFQKKGENTCFQIDRISEKHCIIYSYLRIPRDSILAMVESIKNDSTFVEFRDSTLTIKDKDTVETIDFKIDKGYYLTESEPQYEINLEEGYFRDDFKNSEQKKALLKSYRNQYFLNIIDQQDKWFAVWFEQNKQNLLIRTSVIADSTFAERLDHYKKLTAIEAIADKTYLANPSDEALFRLLNTPNLFNEEIWIRIDYKKEMNFLWKILGSALVVIFLILALKKQREKA